MSRKYNRIAEEFADELRGLKASFPTYERWTMIGAWRIINNWCEQERKRNSLFDTGRFVAYVNKKLTEGDSPEGTSPEAREG